jgi:Kef-type K+ transport system membrane component KefB
MGEFSFVLAAAAAMAGAIPQDLYVAVISAVAVTIACSTVLVRVVGTPRAAPVAEGG